MSIPDPSRSRFAAQAPSAEESLKDQTIGLVQLDDFRKRRRDVAELRSANASGASTPRPDESDPDINPNFKKKKRKTTRKLLSFDEGDDPNQETVSKSTDADDAIEKIQTNEEDLQSLAKRRPKANPNTGLPAPKTMTKASLAAEAAERERIRSEFVKTQEQVRNAVIAIPFVFYDGSSLPGGVVKVKKGEHIWLLLERCRKLGAELGVSSEGSIEGGGSKQRVEGKKSWARIGVDDLMLIRGEIIVPHHYEFYYFILNKIADPSQPEKLLFDYATHVAETEKTNQTNLLRNPSMEKTEGQDDDPSYTKVVDRRWYEKNKHIYPASLWRDYKVGKEYEDHLKGRRDAQGNSFFFA